MPLAFSIVGVGASAGGLEAFLDLLRALPPTTGMAYVLVQHLEPTRESHLPEILSRATTMPVLQAQEGSAVEPNHVYVIPPNASLSIQEGVLRLSPRVDAAQPHYPIDHFFGALADDQDGRAIAVVLSGTSSDGAKGLKMIKCAGGTTFAQDEESAKFGGMPHNAKATGAVDFILPPSAIAAELVRIGAHPFVAVPGGHAERSPAFAQSHADFQKILDFLRISSRVDFSRYKQNTIRRRIARRMLVHNVTTLPQYVGILEGHPSEVDDLYRDLLISVTSFFRDPKVFQSLAGILATRLKTRDRESPFRVWVPGCATGEEAYSLAILIAEATEAMGLPTPLQLFGTDIGEAAIQTARAAVYPDSIQNEVSPHRLSRYFIPVDSGFRISKAIREGCIFARHDLTRDPPFSQLDLVSCRNVLIYLGPGAQQQVLPALHYSLKPEGLLLLGTTEGVGTRSDLFDAVDHDNKIFSRKTSIRRFTMTLPDPAAFEPPFVDRKVKEAVAAPTVGDIEIRAARILRDLFAPPGVIVNESLQILHFFGPTGPFLQPPSGEATLNLLRVANHSLVMPIRRAVDAAVAGNTPVHEKSVLFQTGGQSRQIGLRVIPFTESNVKNYLILFEDQNPSQAPAELPPGAPREPNTTALEFQLTQTRRELTETREYLRTVIEQHEVAIEELRAAHEEVQSSNEELQSTNEEIRTAREELQSSNEELHTVNDELQHRNAELDSSHSDLINVLNAVNIPIVMVGMDSRIRRFTPAAAGLLNLVSGDIGRLVTDVHSRVEVPALENLIKDTIQTLAVQRARVQDREGRWQSVFVRPYRTLDDRIDGAVISFLDIDDLTRALDRAEEAREFAEGIVETVQHPLLVLDGDLRIQRATAAFYRAFQISEAEARGLPIYEISSGQWNIPELRALLDRALIQDVPFRDLEVEHDFPHIGRKVMRLNGRRIVRRDGSSQRLLLAIEDVTERKEAAEIQFHQLFQSAKDGILILDAETGRVTDVNPFFVELARYPRTELVGKPFSEIAPFRQTEVGRNLVPIAMEKEVARFDAVPLQTQDDTRIIVEIVANRYRVQDRTLIQANIRDVTERRNAVEALRRSNLDLQQFAFAASHDLQEPLRTIILHVEYLQEHYLGKLDPEADQNIQFIISAADRMRHMVLDLLSYAQLSRADLAIAAVNAEAVLAMALSNLQLAIESSGARITFDPLPTVSMDQTQFLQLLQNLIANAIKYRRADPPRIHLSARLFGSAEKAGSEWIFTVKDNGEGIEPRYRDQIFTVFRRLHGQDYPGTGIGLATCKRILERHGGRIWVESEPGKGSTFFFAIPA